MMRELGQEALALFLQLSGDSAEMLVKHHELMMAAFEGGRRLQAEREGRL